MAVYDFVDEKRSDYIGGYVGAKFGAIACFIAVAACVISEHYYVIAFIFLIALLNSLNYMFNWNRLLKSGFSIDSETGTFTYRGVTYNCSELHPQYQLFWNEEMKYTLLYEFRLYFVDNRVLKFKLPEYVGLAFMKFLENYSKPIEHKRFLIFPRPSK